MSLRFGLIGTGGGSYLFAGALAGRPGRSRLVSVCSSNREKATDSGSICGDRGLHRLARADKGPDIAAVCLASPTGDHARMTIGAAAQGLHVVTEKPIAGTVADADRMIEACDRAGVTLGCIYMYRFMDTALRMKEAVVDGLIGQPLIADCTGLFYRDQPYYDSGAWRGYHAGSGEAGSVQVGTV